MSFYDAVVPAYLQMLNSLSGLLTKAEAHCAAKKIEPGVLIGSRLFSICRYAGTTFAELKQRLAKTIDYVKSFKPEQFDGADAKDVTFPAGPDRSITMKGQQFLSAFSL